MRVSLAKFLFRGLDLRLECGYFAKKGWRKLAVPQFEIWMNTPKAFANFSPGFEHRENPGDTILIATKP